MRPRPAPESLTDLTRRLAAVARRLFRRSLHVYHVDPGSCGACEGEMLALSGPAWGVERYGIEVVTSPRHADLLTVTGPVTRAMREPLQRTYEAMPDPKIVAAIGACGISCGVFIGSYGVEGPVDLVLPVDVYIPGCPPRPEALLHGLLLALGRREQKLQRVQHVSRSRPRLRVTLNGG